MGNFTDIVLRRRLREADERIANQRHIIEELQDMVDQRDNEIMDLRDEIAAKDRRIDNMVEDTWRPHH